MAAYLDRASDRKTPMPDIDLYGSNQPDQSYYDFKRGFRNIFFNGEPFDKMLAGRGYKGNDLEPQQFTDQHLDSIWEYLISNTLKSETVKPNVSDKEKLKSYFRRYFHQGALLNSLEATIVDFAHENGILICDSGIEKRFNIVTEEGYLLLIEEIKIKKISLRESNKAEHEWPTITAKKGSYLSRVKLTYKLNFLNSKHEIIEPEAEVLSFELQHRHKKTRQIFNIGTIYQKILVFLKSLFGLSYRAKNPELHLKKPNADDQPIPCQGLAVEVLSPGQLNILHPIRPLKKSLKWVLLNELKSLRCLRYLLFFTLPAEKILQDFAVKKVGINEQPEEYKQAANKKEVNPLSRERVALNCGSLLMAVKKA